MQGTTNFDAAEILRPRDVVEMTGGLVTEGTLAWYRHIDDGRGPRWGRLGKRKIFYKRSDVQAWLDAQYNASPADGKASA